MAIDALVGLLILSSALALCLTAVSSARRAATAALEVRQAAALLREVLNTAPNDVNFAQGQSGGFNWQVSSRPDAANALGLRVCQVTAQTVHQISRRRYDLATRRFCVIRETAP